MSNQIIKIKTFHKKKGRFCCPLCDSPHVSVYKYSDVKIRYCKDCHYEEIMDWFNQEVIA